MATVSSRRSSEQQFGAMRVCLKHMSDEEIAELFAEVDEDDSGTIDLEEFDAWMQRCRQTHYRRADKSAVEDAG